jgi:hypothetical protein
MALPVGPVVYSVTVNGTLITDFPLDVELEQCWGNHDIFTIRIEYPRTKLDVTSMSLWPDNAPVQVVWGRRPDNIQTWFGYVNHNAPASHADSGSKALQITYYLIGCSYPMNTDKTRTWGEVTATYIAKQIAAEYGFRTVLSTSNWVLPYEVQANESDFSFLNRMADKVGFRFWVSNGTLYFIDPGSVLQGASSQGVPQYTLDKRFDQVDTVRNFRMNQGANLPGATKAVRSIYGIDNTSGKVFKVSATNAPVSNIEQTMTTWPVNNMSQAQNLVDAWQSRSQFFISASAELFGNVYVYPGKLVYLSGLQMPANSAGYWIVGSADHLMLASGTSLSTSDKYVTRVQLIKNATGFTPALSTVSQVNPEFVNCQVINGQWQSTDMSVLYNGVAQ